jgi:hypothetical protein
MKRKEEVVELHKIDIRKMELTLIGDTPLIVHNFSEKEKRHMLDSQLGKAVRKKPLRDPVADFIHSLYWLSEKPKGKTIEDFQKAVQNGAVFGFPTVGFKAAAISGGYRAKLVKDKVTPRGAFYIEGVFAVINGVPEMREDMVRLSGIGNPANNRFRGEFKIWSVSLDIKYDANAITPEILVNMFNYAGFAVGVGEWRVEKGGQYGMFHVKTE